MFNLSGLLPFGKKKHPATPVPNQPGIAPVVPTKKEVNQKQIDLQKHIDTLAQGLVSVSDIIAPGAVEVDFNHLKMSDHYVQTLFVAGYPRYVSPNWLSPLISFNHTLDIAMFIYPQDSKEILDNLRRKVGEMEATIQSDIKRGRVLEPSVQVALEDALGLQQQLAKGAEKFFQFGLYITIPADTPEELSKTSSQIQSTLASLLIMTKKASLQMEEGFKSTLPFCSDRLLITRNMDTTSLATTFPFTTSELTANEGILYGLNEHNDSLVIFDRFSLENANSVILGKSIASWENVLIRQDGKVRMEKIGSLIENCIAQRGISYKDEEMEGVCLPPFEVYSYDKNLKGSWTPVSIAARKPFSRREHLYSITTKSGRKVTVTADHSLIVLRDGKPSALCGSAVRIGHALPVPRHIPEPRTAESRIDPNIIIAHWPKDLPQSIPWNTNFATLLGFITSEAYIDNRMLVIFNQDPLVLDLIKHISQTLGLRVSQRTNTAHTVRGYSIGPNVFAKLCVALGAGGKSGEKRVPPAFFSLSNEILSAYLRAYFEGDGTVEKWSITATTKSYELAGDLAYLLFRFGIITRIHPRVKRATNAHHQGSTYYQLTISGQKHISLFAKSIGFISERKNEKLASIMDKKENTHIDTIPTLEPIFQKLYRMLYQGNSIAAPNNFSSLKRGVFNPSPKQLSEIITAIENRIETLRKLKTAMMFLQKLPRLETLIQRGTRNRKLNKALWKELGHSWQLMKQKTVIPGIVNVLRAYKTVSGETIDILEVKHVLYETFRETGISLEDYNNSLWAALTHEFRRAGDTAYPTVFEAVQFLRKKYRSLQLTLRHAKRYANQLKTLANSDLFWDPVAKIEKIKHRERYVYDLTVDNQVFLTGQGGLFVHNSGAGKSFMIKLEVLRALMFDTEVIVIDPEAEYEKLCTAVNGEYISFSFNSEHKINPFDLSQVVTEGENELGLKILSLHGLLRVIMGKLSPEEDALLDRALVLTYKQKNITPDPETQKKEPPLMEDLFKVLVGMEDPSAKSLADRIEKFVKGSLVGIFNQQSNINIKNQFTVFSIRDLEDELRPIAMYMILDYIWTKVRRDLKKRILIVDEAWYMMRYPDSAAFLNSVAKRARKYYLGLTTISQDVEDFLSVELGKTIIQNSSLQILLKQSTSAIEHLAQVFFLSEGEKHLLLSADIGEGLFFAGSSHVAIRVIASEDEHHIATTSPKERIEEENSKLEIGSVKTDEQDLKPIAPPPLVQPPISNLQHPISSLQPLTSPPAPPRPIMTTQIVGQPINTPTLINQ